MRSKEQEGGAVFAFDSIMKYSAEQADTALILSPDSLESTVQMGMECREMRLSSPPLKRAMEPESH